MMLKEALDKVTSKENIDYKEIKALLDQTIDGEIDEIKFAAFLAALKTKGETIDEIMAFIDTFYQRADKIDFVDSKVIDTCGTGGDGKGTFNISTAIAILLSCFGLKVAKHGNRSITSKSGSADILEELGIDIMSPKEKVQEGLEKIGFAFLFAPKYHPAMKKVAGVRKALGVRTIFNLLGPLLNPAKINYQVVGTYDFDAQEKIAMVLKNKNERKRFAVLHSMDGLDEISVSHKTKVLEYANGKLHEYFIDPSEYGISFDLEAIKGYTPRENASILKSIFEGEKSSYYWAVVLNAGFSLYVSEVANNIKEGIDLVQKAIDSGEANLKLKQIQEFYRIG